MEFGDRVKEARQRAGISQSALAHRAEMSLQGVAKIEQGGVADPHYSTLQRLANALGVNPLWLVTGKEAEESAPLDEPPSTSASSSKDVTGAGQSATTEDTGDRVDEEQRLLKLAQPWMMLLQTEAEHLELQVSEGLVSHDSFQRALARRGEIAENLKTLVEDLSEEGFDWEDRNRRRPSRSVRKKLQSVFSRWSRAFEDVKKAYSDMTLEGSQLDERRALHHEDDEQEERIQEMDRLLAVG